MFDNTLGQGIKLYIGSGAGSIKGEKVVLNGNRCFSAAYSASRSNCKSLDPQAVEILLDSGAFSDAPEKRLTAELALKRQLDWEENAAKIWGLNTYQVGALASYDYLIDELWIEGKKSKRRWSVKDAEKAVVETISNAFYLASQRRKLSPRRLVLVAQGVDKSQYLQCIDKILTISKPGDILGLGGWCILGTFLGYYWRETFSEVIEAAAKQIKGAGIEQIHIFGCTYLPSLGKALWLCDRFGLKISVDSSRPLLDHTRSDLKKAGARGGNWQASVTWWTNTLANLRHSKYYVNPNQNKQLSLSLFART